MTNPQLSDEQRQNIFRPLFERIKAELIRLSAGDEKLLWALRRKLTKELGHLERSNPMVRSRLKVKKWNQQNGICPICDKPLPKKNSELDRRDAFHGYTEENTRLVHHDCHIVEQKKKGYA